MGKSVYRALLFSAILAAVTSCTLPAVRVKEEALLTSGEHLQLAHIYEARGEYDLALENLRKALLLDPENPEIHFSMGNLYLRLKDYGGAEASYLRALELDPGSGPALNNLAWVYMETGRPDMARSATLNALEKDPERSYIYLDTLGVVEARAGNLTDAEKNFSKALELIPVEEREGRREILTNLLELYRKTGDKGKELEVEEKIKELD